MQVKGSIKTAFNQSTRQWIREILILLLGSLLAAIAVNIFYVPIRLTMGGISGIVSIIYQVTGRGEFLPFGVLFGILNIPLLILGWKRIHSNFVWRSLVGTAMYAVMIDITQPALTVFYERQLYSPTGDFSADPLLFCLIGGVLYGIGLGLTFRAGYTTGGTDILVMVIHRKSAFLSIGQFLLVMDALIIFASAIVYRNQTESGFLLALYSFIAMYLTSKSIDVVLEGFDYCRTAVIISDHGREIAARILKELDRGVTGLAGEGMYTGDEKKILMCVLSRRQIPAMKRIVKEIDSEAFVIVQDAREVLGEGFGNYAQF